MHPPHPVHLVDSNVAHHHPNQFYSAAVLPVLAVLLLWIILGFDEVYGMKLDQFGIYPRTLIGLRGIVLAPFIHGGVEHLFNNSIPLLLLGWALMYFYPKASGRVVLVSWLTTGLWVWVMGREAFHIGASGIVYALATFIFFSGVFRRNRSLMALSLIVTFLYGSLWWGVLPIQQGVSWESHLAGGIVGILLAWFYRKVAPSHVAPATAEEPDEDENDDDAMPGNDPGDEHVAHEQHPHHGHHPMYHPSRTSSTFPL